MPRVLVFGALATLLAGRPSIPRDRFYGAAFFAGRGYEVTAADLATYHRWRATTVRVIGRSQLPGVGDVPGPLLSLPLIRRADVIYNHADIDPVLPLHVLRAARLVRTPVVTLVHSPPLTRGRAWPAAAWKALFRGSDAIVTFSHAVADDIRRLPRRAARVVVLPLGPDLDAYPRPTYPGEGILCAGLSHRDRITFGRGASLAGVPAEIVTPTAFVLPEFSSFAANVRVTIPKHDRISPGDVHARAAASRALAVPLAETRLMIGAWQLCDALGVGKPIVMTRQRLLDIDIQKEGIGFWAEPGDPRSWVEPLRVLTNDPDRAVAMGRAARQLAERGYNAGTFADGIMDVFDRLLGIDTRCDAAATPPV
jgi:glycosyltransferase involved in cell wall biosynthesis